MYNFKIIEEKDYDTELEGVIVTDKGNIQCKVLRVVVVSKIDPYKIRYGAIRYAVGSRTKAMTEIKRKLAVSFK